MTATIPANVAIIAISDGTPPHKPNPVNALGAPVRSFLQTSLRRALADPAVAAVILVGRPDGRGAFSAGADIREFAGDAAADGGVTTSEPGGVPTLNDLAHLVEGAPKPVVAALTGACLGGGMELALAAQYRVADATLRYGLPEVKLGLLPGAGGTQRLPRLCGVRHALEAIVRGRTGGDAATLESRRLCRRAVPPDGEGVENGDLCDFALGSLPPRDRGGESAHACVAAVRASFALPSFEDGMAAEKELFNDLLYHSLQGRAYRHIFFAERAASSSASGPSKARSQLGKGQGSVGVIGAGTMGRGIAIAFLRAGFGPVTLVDVSPKGLAAGVRYIQAVFQGEVAKGRRSSAQAQAALARLASATDLARLADCDIVVEAVFENLKVKRDIFAQLDTIVAKPEALLLSNTSTLDVDVVAAALSPARRAFCAGMHFFSPAHVMKLVEVIRGRDTAPATLDAVRAVTKRLKKVPVVVGNCDGFVGNRMVHPYTTEAALLLAEGGGGVADVDAAAGPQGFGMAVGPFAMSDLAGNDIGYNIRREKGLLRDARTGAVGPKRRQMRYTELADEMVERLGRLGQKAHKGWYDYDPKVGKGRKPLPSAEMRGLIEKYAGNSPRRGTTLSPDDIVRRVIFPLVNEGFKALEEGIAADPADIDVIYLYGYGWPAWRGGPMFYADNDVGLPALLAALEGFHAAYPGSEYFRPSALLRKCAGMGIGVQEYYRRGYAKAPSPAASKL